MNNDRLNIRAFEAQDEMHVTALWESCALTRPWNPPKRDISEKQKLQDELFLVLEYEKQIIGSVMAGYDGHRGSVNYLAVHPDFRGNGYAKLLMEAVEKRLRQMGCPKINLMVRKDNLAVLDFYETRGYQEQDCVVLGKWLND